MLAKSRLISTWLPSKNLLQYLRYNYSMPGTATNPLTPFVEDSTKGPTIQAVAKLLASDEIRNVVILAGAGISTASGIPDFRSPDTGLYANLAKYSLPYPEAIFEISYFQDKPQPFFTLSKELYPGNFQPTLTHYFFRLLHEKGKLLRVFTQNIDTLERIAGLPADKIVEAHGSFATSRCIKCKKAVEETWMKDKCMKGEVAYCPKKDCQKRTPGGKGGLVKPDIVFFGEGLPERFFNQLSDLKKADLLITMGTSLQVQPFASLIDRVDPTCPRLLINLERVGDIGGEDYLEDGGYSPDAADGYGSRGMFSMFRESGFDFFGRGMRDKTKIRDVFYKGKTDQGVRVLAKACGWEDELQEIYDGEAKKFGGTRAEGVTSDADARTEAKKLAAEIADKDKEAGATDNSTKDPDGAVTTSSDAGAPTTSKSLQVDLADEVAKLSVGDDDAKTDKTSGKM